MSVSNFLAVNQALIGRNGYSFIAKYDIVLFPRSRSRARTKGTEFIHEDSMDSMTSDTLLSMDTTPPASTVGDPLGLEAVRMDVDPMDIGAEESALGYSGTKIYLFYL